MSNWFQNLLFSFQPQDPGFHGQDKVYGDLGEEMLEHSFEGNAGTKTIKHFYVYLHQNTYPTYVNIPTCIYLPAHTNLLSSIYPSLPIHKHKYIITAGPGAGIGLLEKAFYTDQWPLKLDLLLSMAFLSNFRPGLRRSGLFRDMLVDLVSGDVNEIGSDSNSGLNVKFVFKVVVEVVVRLPHKIKNGHAGNCKV